MNNMLKKFGFAAMVAAISLAFFACGNADLADFPVAPPEPEVVEPVTVDISSITEENIKKWAWDEAGAYEIKVEDGKFVITQSKAPNQYSSAAIDVPAASFEKRNTVSLKIANKGTKDAIVAVNIVKRGTAANDYQPTPAVASMEVKVDEAEAKAVVALGEKVTVKDGYGDPVKIPAGKTSVWKIVYDASKKPDSIQFQLNSADKDCPTEGKIEISDISIEKSDDADKAVAEAAEKQKKIDAIKGLWVVEDVGFYFNDGKLYIAEKDDDGWVYIAEMAMDYEFDGEKLTLKVTDEEEDETEEVEITATVTDKKLTLKLPKEALEDMKEFFGEDAKETIELTKSDAKPKKAAAADGSIVLEPGEADMIGSGWWDGAYKYKFEEPTDLTGMTLVATISVSENWTWAGDGATDDNDWARNIWLEVAGGYEMQGEEEKQTSVLRVAVFAAAKDSKSASNDTAKVKEEFGGEGKEITVKMADVAAVTEKKDGLELADITKVAGIQFNTCTGTGKFTVKSIKLVPAEASK